MLRFAFAALIVGSVYLSIAYAHDYMVPDLDGYYASLIQPDSTASCCGKADAYWADDAETDANGNLVAIITDTRTEQQQPRYTNKPIPPGTRVMVPESKIRKHPIPNPTGHTIIFMSGAGTVYCYEPLPGI
jgi:hypothetical protein